jgi:hypothetical protein
MKHTQEKLFGGSILTALTKPIYYALTRGEDMEAAGITEPGNTTYSGSWLQIGKDEPELCERVADTAKISLEDATVKVREKLADKEIAESGDADSFAIS